MVEHLTADQEVPSSNLGTPYTFLFLFLLFLDYICLIVKESFCSLQTMHTIHDTNCCCVCRLVIQCSFCYDRLLISALYQLVLKVSLHNVHLSLLCLP